MIYTAAGNYPKVPNLPRPARVRIALSALDQGKITVKELHNVFDEVTAEVIQEQIQADLDLVTDGQIRWDDPITYVARQLAGVELSGLIRYFDTNTLYRKPVVKNSLRWTHPILVQDFQFAQTHSSIPVKAVLPGPYSLAKMVKDVHYNHLGKLVMGLAECLNHEAKALQAAGACYLQFDEPMIVWRDNKKDFSLFRQAMEAVTKKIHVKKALNIFFGDVEGLYPALLDLPFDVLGLDFVTSSKNFKVIKKAKFVKELGAGVVDARNTKLETEAELVSALKEISKSVPLSHVTLSPHCGLEFLPRERALLKLKNMVKFTRHLD